MNYCIIYHIIISYYYCCLLYIIQPRGSSFGPRPPGRPAASPVVQYDIIK